MIGTEELKHAQHWHEWIERAKTISVFFVAIGVVGEFLGDWMDKPHVRIIEAARGEELARLQTESDSARARIAQAQVQIADAHKEAAAANAHAAEANRIAEGERLARVKIEERMAPRRLTIEQQQRVIAQITPFGRQSYSPGVTNQTEAIDFLRVMERVFQSAGWHKSFVQIADINVGDASLINCSGVEIQIADRYVTELRPAASALTAALQAEGIAAKTIVSKERDSNIKVIYILIGEKPR